MEALVHASEKAANIARLCRQNEHLFPLLVQEKPTEESNPRFVKDFKTLADVLIQQTIRYDVGNLVWIIHLFFFLLISFSHSVVIASIVVAIYFYSVSSFRFIPIAIQL